MEIKKKAMFRFLKSKAKSDTKIAELEKAQMVMMLDREIESWRKKNDLPWSLVKVQLRSLYNSNSFRNFAILGAITGNRELLGSAHSTLVVILRDKTPQSHDL